MDQRHVEARTKLYFVAPNHPREPLDPPPQSGRYGGMLTGIADVGPYGTALSGYESADLSRKELWQIIAAHRREERQAREEVAGLLALHRRKDEFLAILSHELRSPLAPIADAVQLLRRQGQETPIQQRACAVIERQVARLKELVGDLLEGTHIAADKIQLRQERVAANDIAQCGVETARPLIEQRKHELTVSVSPQPIWLYADAHRLEQVVVNLLVNAAKYTDEGGHIWLTVQQDGDECVVRVSDTGGGIAPELLPRIFDLFTQGPRSSNHAQDGLGIGLCLVQRLVTLHGGTVEAHSVLGRGSEFVVRLPIVPTATPQASEVTTEPSPTRPLRVLVVDDHVDTTECLATLLRMSGNDVRTAYDGVSALQAAVDYRPDMALLDIGLPGLDGFDLAQRIRGQSGLQSVVLVAVTGHGQESDRQRSRQAGFDHHLTKPTDFGAVEQILVSISQKATRRPLDS